MGFTVMTVLTVALHIHLMCAQTVDVRCTEQFCKGQTEQFPCQELPAECKDNNTMNGIIMLEPSTCNCCDYCIPYLKEGDLCVLDGKGQPVYEAVCGPGLWCEEVPNSDSATCSPIVSECTNEQKDYDEGMKNGSLGFTRVRPLCDEKGDYLPAYCIGNSICYCVNPKGERIFGEKVFSSFSVQENMKCECSLAAWKAEKLAKEMEIYSQAIHCLEDGSYDPLQCDDSNWCRCLQKGSDIPDSDLVFELNIKENNPKCFDPNIHQEGKYTRKCEAEAMRIKQTREYLLSADIFPAGLRFPHCQYDGQYSRVMINDTVKDCVDPDGNSLGYSVQRNDSLSDGMDCNCARTRFVLKREGETELPTCCKNGNFRGIQCRRGKCYCVDCNGNQQGLELDEARKADLDCDDSCAIC